MDPNRFDALTRSLTSLRHRAPSRRGLLHAVGGGLLAAAAVEAPAADAAKKPCKGGKKRCGKKCVDVQTSAANCGKCKNKCGANLVCEGGACVAAPDRCPTVTVCNDPNGVSCGTTAGIEQNPCTCGRTVEGNTACINFIEKCEDFPPCESTQECRDTVGFHFFCQAPKTDAQGRPCGCGRRCLPECDNPGL